MLCCDDEAQGSEANSILNGEGGEEGSFLEGPITAPGANRRNHAINPPGDPPPLLCVNLPMLLLMHLWDPCSCFYIT